jgi:hypothetical protein
LELDPMSITSIQELRVKEKLKSGVTISPLLSFPFSVIQPLMGSQYIAFRKVDIEDDDGNESVKFIEIEVQRGEVVSFKVFDEYTY